MAAAGATKVARMARAIRMRMLKEVSGESRGADGIAECGSGQLPKASLPKASLPMTSLRRRRLDFRRLQLDRRIEGVARVDRALCRPALLHQHAIGQMAGRIDIEGVVGGGSAGKVDLVG